MNQRTLMSRCHKPGLNPRHASFVSGSAGAAFFSADFFSGFVRTSVAILLRAIAPSVNVSAKREVLGQSRFARFLVLCAHVLSGIDEGCDRGVKHSLLTRRAST